STREKRRKCWEARDQYLTCLDNVGVLKHGRVAFVVCSSENEAYERNCAKS
ncbi:hypothetical protein F5050DRAFT_1577821, partial [Lentinula boryana]